MNKRAVEDIKRTEWTSLIDIIFQLLIYFMVTLALGTVTQKASAQVKGSEREDLPQLPTVSKLADVSPLLDSYLLHVDRAKQGKYRGELVGYILDAQYSSIKEAERDSLGEHGPWPLEQAKQILKKRVEDKIFLGEKPSQIELRIHEETKFGYILDIMDFCDKDSIETVVFHFSKKKGDEE
ncbi:biopolymer transporter ExbD [bacterium]|nr:biopolymer transporter ExbD [bacterium]